MPELHTYLLGAIHATIAALVIGLLRAAVRHRQERARIEAAFDQGYEAGRARQRSEDAAARLGMTTTGMRLPRPELVITPIAQGRGVRVRPKQPMTTNDDGKGAA